jgi:hypothetical protein
VPPTSGLSHTMPNDPIVLGTVEIEGGGKAKIVKSDAGNAGTPTYIAVIEEADDLIKRILAKNKIPYSIDIRNTLQGIIGKIDGDVAEKFAGEFTSHLNKLGLTEADAPKKIKLFEELKNALGDPKIGLGKIVTEGDFSDEIVEVWDKVSGSGITDMSTSSGYAETLTKMAKYKKEAGGTGTVKYYRVQGGQGSNPGQVSQELIDVLPDGNLVFNKTQNALNLSTDNLEHALDYIKRERPGGKIVEFEVPKSIDDQMKAAAVPQYKATQNLLNPDKIAPKVVDPNLPGNPFELPSYWHQIIQQNYIVGSGKIIN